MDSELFDSQYTNKETIKWVNQTSKEISSTLGIGGGGIDFDLRRIATTIEYVKTLTCLTGLLSK